MPGRRPSGPKCDPQHPARQSRDERKPRRLGQSLIFNGRGLTLEGLEEFVQPFGVGGALGAGEYAH